MNPRPRPKIAGQKRASAMLKRGSSADDGKGGIPGKLRTGAVQAMRELARRKAAGMAMKVGSPTYTRFDPPAGGHS